MSGNIFRNGAPAILAVFLIIKGSSSLRCKKADVVLSVAIFALVSLSKVVPARIISPAALQAAALAIVIVFAFTGLKLRTILTDRRTAGGA